MKRRNLTTLLKAVLIVLALCVPFYARAGGFSSQRYEDLTKARTIFEDILKKKPDDIETWQLLADACANLGEESKAIKIYEGLTKKKPDDPTNWYRSGELRLARGEQIISAKRFKKALKLLAVQKKNNEANDIWEGITWARLLALAGFSKDSSSSFDKLEQSHPESMEVKESRIETLLETGEEKQALRIVMGELNLDRDNYGFKKLEIRALARIGKSKEAAKKGRELLKTHQDDHVLARDTAFACFHAEEYDCATTLANRLSVEMPWDKDIAKLKKDALWRKKTVLSLGLDFHKGEDENGMGPRLWIRQPLVEMLWLNAEVSGRRDKAAIQNFDPEYTKMVYEVSMGAEWHPYPKMSLEAAFVNMMRGNDYEPAGMLSFRIPTYQTGELRLYGEINQLVEDPAAALAFSGRRHRAELDLEQILADRFDITAIYSSNWYVVDGDKIPGGGPNDFARSDEFDTAALARVYSKPRIWLGYGLELQRLHIANNYTEFIPLLTHATAHSMRLLMTYEFIPTAEITAGGYLGGDPSRNIAYGRLVGGQVGLDVTIAERVELQGRYEYSRQSSTQSVGQYHFFMLGARVRL